MLDCTQKLALLIQTSPKASPVLPPLPLPSLPRALQLLHRSALLATAAGSFPSRVPREPSSAERPWHLLPQSHSPCVRAAHVAPTPLAPLWPGRSCKAAATLR